MSLRGKTAIVGIAATEYYRRGQSAPRSELSMACDVILAALEEAGLSADDLDGFAIYSNSCSPAQISETLGIPEVRFAATLTAGGGGSAGALGLAAMAVASGMAECVVTLMTLQQTNRRLGRSATDTSVPAAPASPYGSGGVSPDYAFHAASGLISPGHNFSMLTQRHMHLYGTKREHLAEVCISQRENAITRPTALRKDPLTLDEYMSSRMISDPLCIYDYTMESDGAVAVITTSLDRARDLKQPPVIIQGSAHGGAGRWGQALFRFQMPDDIWCSSGHRSVAKRVYESAGVGPQDIDVALLYDHFSPLVLMQLEDYGFCPIGESGPFVADGNIRFKGGSIPVNTHGGNLSEAYIIGMTHVIEAVEQIRGTAVNQVRDAKLALVTGGPASLPGSATILGRA